MQEKIKKVSDKKEAISNKHVLSSAFAINLKKLEPKQIYKTIRSNFERINNESENLLQFKSVKNNIVALQRLKPDPIKKQQKDPFVTIGYNVEDKNIEQTVNTSDLKKKYVERYIHRFKKYEQDGFVLCLRRAEESFERFLYNLKHKIFVLRLPDDVEYTNRDFCDYYTSLKVRIKKDVRIFDEIIIPSIESSFDRIRSSDLSLDS